MRRRIEKIKDAHYERGYVYNFHYHLIWVTKYRRMIFVNQTMVQEMKDLLQSIATDNEIVIENMEVMPDHIHLLISMKPKLAPSTAVKILKGRSAALFFQRYPEYKKDMFWGGHLWANSYYMSTLGDMSKEIVEQYINNQYQKENRLNSSRD